MHLTLFYSKLLSFQTIAFFVQVKCTHLTCSVFQVFLTLSGEACWYDPRDTFFLIIYFWNIFAHVIKLQIFLSLQFCKMISIIPLVITRGLSYL